MFITFYTLTDILQKKKKCITSEVTFAEIQLQEKKNQYCIRNKTTELRQY